MSSSRHIPGIPYMGTSVVLSRLSRAAAFATLPRGPVKFRKNIKCRELPSSPPSKLPRFIAPGAPRRRRALQVTPKRAIPFPAISKPVTPPPSPPRLCVWETPSMSKNGVSRSLQKRFFDPATPPRSRIPVAVPLRSCIAPIPCCPDAPRKKVAFADYLSTTFTPVLPSPSPKPSRLTFSWRKPHVAHAPPVYARPSVPRRQTEDRGVNSLRSILVRSRSDEVRAKKSVRFGEVNVSEVEFWVDRKKHVFQDGGLWKLGRLQGWRVTPLDTPDEDGETEKYMTMWGHDHSSLYYHTNAPECPHEGCVWGKIAHFMLRHKRRGLNLACDHERLLVLWSEWRQRARDLGYWKL